MEISPPGLQQNGIAIQVQTAAIIVVTSVIGAAAITSRAINTGRQLGVGSKNRYAIFSPTG